jgi:ribosomal protein S18 acetylase RimI-like enzyme
MTPTDLLKFNPCNLDHLTETYNIGFYLEYFTKWPQLCKVIESESGQIEAYSMSFSNPEGSLTDEISFGKGGSITVPCSG